MKIIITGSESFVGRELIRQCLLGGFEVYGVDLLEAPSQDYAYHRADIRKESVTECIPENADALIHLAALSTDAMCRGKLYECFDVNVLGTLNLMRAATAKNVKQFIFASSEWVYEKFLGDEEKNEEAIIDIAGHTSEYALSKLVSEANMRIQHANGFSAATILRFGIIYGPRKAPPAGGWGAVESIMSQVKHQEEVTVGSVRSGRRFIHIEDIAGGIIQAIGLGGFEIINLCGDRLITLGEIIKESEKIFGKKVRIIEKTPEEVSVRNPLNEKAKRLLNWKQKIDVATGLKTLLPFV
ncbi:MAG: NAD(P)-dependent oxidoreductase [bacterium]|nr:NAD(P)-dependent oxidoreductase [bacterium]